MISASPNNPANPLPELDLEVLMPATYAHPPTRLCVYAQQMIFEAPKLTKVATVVATAALAIALPATARADSHYFQSPSGNILCAIDDGSAACDISDSTYQPPPPLDCGKHIPSGSHFTLTPGNPGTIECYGDTLRVLVQPTLEYGRTISAGTITCDNEPSGMKCTDTSSGHFFQIGRNAYNLG